MVAVTDIPGRTRAVDDAGGLGLSCGVLTVVVARGTVGPRPTFFLSAPGKSGRGVRMETDGAT